MKAFYFTIFFIFIFFSVSIHADETLLKLDNEKISEDSNQLLELYHLEPGQTWKDITQQVYQSNSASIDMKSAIIYQNRRIILFSYPSEGVLIKALVSFTPKSSQQPLLVVFRGGNQTFGLLNPGSEWLSYQDHLIVSSTLRGGVSEGQDEFGGKDVQDVIHLMNYLPNFITQFGLSYAPSQIDFLGISRGAMEMFITLAQFPVLQAKVHKVVSLSGLLDLKDQIANRPDMVKMFEQNFGLIRSSNEQEWIEKRNPLDKAALIDSSIPILLIQGTKDLRVRPIEAQEMYKQLKNYHHLACLWEIQDGNHTLNNVPLIKTQVFNWLNSSATTC